MLFNAENGKIKLGESDMDYVAFGKGEKNVLIIPGLGDGLKTVKGMAYVFALMYAKLARHCRVYIFSRKNVLPEGYSTKDMAHDLSEALKALDIEKTSVIGVSQGGMIAQYLAIEARERIEKLVLVVTLASQNEMVKTVVGNWIDMAKQNKYKEITIDTAEKMYTEKHLKQMRPFYFMLGLAGKPKNMERFIIQACACLKHESIGEIDKITCPTLVIGAREDKVLGVFASEEIAEKILDCELYIYDGYGHGVYEEAKDFFPRVIDFLFPNKLR